MSIYFLCFLVLCGAHTATDFFSVLTIIFLKHINFFDANLNSFRKRFETVNLHGASVGELVRKRCISQRRLIFCPHCVRQRQKSTLRMHFINGQRGQWHQWPTDITNSVCVIVFFTIKSNMCSCSVLFLSGSRNTFTYSETFRWFFLRKISLYYRCLLKTLHLLCFLILIYVIIDWLFQTRELHLFWVPSVYVVFKELPIT